MLSSVTKTGTGNGSSRRHCAIHRPIFLIGPQRSGTTWVGDALGQAADIAYWVEPRTVWVYGNWFKPNDVLTAEDATDRVKAYIQWRFERFVKKQRKSRFCEKTPGNCVRIPFIREIFPDGLFVFLVRDGRAVFRSTDKRLKDGIELQPIVRRLRETFVWEYPAHFSRIPWLWNRITGRPLQYWGIKPAGWSDWVASDSPNVVLAKQWASAVSVALADLATVPDSQKIFLKYEELVDNPRDVASTLTDFVETCDSESVTDYLVSTGKKSPVSVWKESIDRAVLSEIRPYIQPTLELLGYEW